CHVPQRDVVEFLSFVLPPGSTEWSYYIEYHHQALKAAYERGGHHAGPVEGSRCPSPSSSSTPIMVPSLREYMEISKLALMDFASLRIAMYGISNSFKQVEWLPRILASVEGQIKRMGPVSLRPFQDKVHLESKL